MQLQVNVANGNLLAEATDVAIKGTGHDLVVGRVWQSLSAGTSTPYGIWNNWAMSTGQDVQLLGAGTSTVTFVDGTGAQYTFTQNGSAYTSPPGIDATLVKNGDGSFTLTFHATGERYTFAMTTGSQGTIPSLTADADQDGNAIAFAYNTGLFGYGQLETITDTQGRQVALTWDQLDTQLQQLADPTGRTWRYGYGPGSYPNLTGYTDPNGKQTAYAYDQANNLNQITDPNSNVTKLAYDAQHRVTAITFGQGSSVAGTYTFTYNAGNTVVTDPNSHQTTYYFDSQLRLTKETDALSNSFQWTWTADNHVNVYTDGKGQAFTYAYEDAAHPDNLTKVTIPTGAQTQMAYGDSGHPYYPTAITDPQGNVTTYHYTAAGDPDTITNQLPSQNQTQLFYNTNGTVDHVVDARGNSTQYSYDGQGNLTKITPPTPLGPTSSAPDPLSRDGSITDGKGQQTTYSYDALDRVTAVRYADGSTITYYPDADGNLLQLVDNTGTTTYQFDARNRQVQKVLPASLGGGTLSYGHDSANNLTSFTDAGGTVSYHYNAADLVDILTEPGTLGQTTFTYDANHRRISTAFPGGTVQTQTYDNSGRLSTISARSGGGTTLTSYANNYQKNTTGPDTALVYGITDTVNGRSVQQTYDVLNRLTQWQVTPTTGSSAQPHTYSYAYDGVGNRTSITADGIATTLTYNAANEWTTAVSGGKTANYTWDAAGNETGNDGFGDPNKALQITYNAKNQVATITDTATPPNTIPMTYSGAGQAQRVNAQWVASNPDTPGGPATYRYGDALVNQADNSGTIYYTRDPFGTLISQRLPNGTVYHYLFDGQGDVVRLVDPSGNVVATYFYCPTGNPAEPNQGPAASGNPWRQMGMFFEPGTKDYVFPNGLRMDSNSGNVTQLASGTTCTLQTLSFLSEDASFVTGPDLPSTGPDTPDSPQPQICATTWWGTLCIPLPEGQRPFARRLWKCTSTMNVHGPTPNCQYKTITGHGTGANKQDAMSAADQDVYAQLRARYGPGGDLQGCFVRHPRYKCSDK